MSEKRKALSYPKRIQFAIYNANKCRGFKKENKTLTDRPIVFLGDSITDICDLRKYYPGLNAVNRGVSANSTHHVLKRLKVSVYDANPTEIVLLIGINDMMNLLRKPKDIAPRYEAIVKALKENCPDAKLVCQSVYPGWHGDEKKAEWGVCKLEDLASDIVELNSYIKDICQKYGCTYADIHSAIKLPDNTMINAYSFDGCHPNEAGYEVISAELIKYI